MYQDVSLLAQLHTADNWVSFFSEKKSSAEIQSFFVFSWCKEIVDTVIQQSDAQCVQMHLHPTSSNIMETRHMLQSGFSISSTGGDSVERHQLCFMMQKEER